MKKLFTTLTFLVLGLTLMAQVPAFPGAEGHGRYTSGGRGGKIIHVTNLKDSGTGSFREAVKGDDKKVIVFDVGGVIALNSDLTIGANTTILGQTAPEPGITLRYYTLLYGGNNIVVRFIRSRRGEERDINDGADASWTRNKTGIILDHCSFSWSIDEVASFYDNNNFTMQWCTIGESLVNAGHSKDNHGYGGIWGGKLASFHHNLICHVKNRSPRFNGARYNWNGYTGNKLYAQYRWDNTLQAENVDFRNCVVYNANGCYGGPGGGQINMVGNYFKSGPGATVTKLTEVSVASSGNAGNDQTFWGMTSRYYVEGNSIDNKPAGFDRFIYDAGTYVIDGKPYSPDPKHYNGSDVTYVKNTAGTDCVCIELENPAPAGEITTHSAEKASQKVLKYAGASLTPDEVDLRYFEEAINGTATYRGSVTGGQGHIDRVSDANGYTENTFGTGSREPGFDSDNDGMPDAWEKANGLTPNDASDATAYTLDPANYYTNIEVYANSLVQDIMLQGNADSEEAAKEYYPQYTKEDGTVVEAINTLGLDLSGTAGPSQEAALYTVSFNSSDIETPEGFFTYEGNHNFNSKFAGVYDGMTFNSGLKMEGSTVIKFTTGSPSTVTIVQSTWSTHTIRLDGEELSVASATTPNDTKNKNIRIYTLTDVPAGDHSITRGSGESGLFYIEVQTYGTNGVTAPHASATVANGAIYNLSGQRVNSNYRGLVIKNGKKVILK